MSDPDGGEGDGARPNRWEIALWAVGVVLTVGSTIAIVVVTRYLYNQSNDGVSQADQMVRANYDILETVAPEVFATGLLSLVIAIALRAWTARGRSAAQISPVQRSELAEESVLEQQSAASGAPNSLRATEAKSAPAAQPVDISVFMRPGGSPLESRDSPRGAPLNLDRTKE